MGLYCGIDLHANNSVIAVQDEQDRPVLEKRLANDLELIIEQLWPYRQDLVGCVVESTYNWYWLVDGLRDAGFPMHLANTAAIPQYQGLKHTNDHSDARHLAHLLRLGILPEGYIYPRAQRMVRDLLRRRALMVRHTTMQKLSLMGLITRHTGRPVSGKTLLGLEPQQLDDWLEQPAAFGGKVALATIHWLGHQSQQLEREVLRRVKSQPDYELLQSIPGVGAVLGMSIALETGCIDRFPNAGHYASYARCVKSVKLSNGKPKGHNNRKNGNKYLAWALMEAAHHGAIHSPQIRRFYQRKRSRCHLMVAKKTVANKLARAVYYMLSRQQRFDVRRAFG